MIKEVINKNFAVLVFAILTSTIGMVIDGIFIGRFLGSEQIAAYGIVGPVFVLFSAIAGVFQSGAQAQCAQYMGKGEMDRAIQVFSLTAVVTLILSAVLMAGCYIFADPIVMLLSGGGTSGDIFTYARAYIYGLLPMLPAFLLTNMLSSLMQLDSDAPRAFIATLAMTAANITGDILNVFVFKGGMSGMAMATTVSYFVDVGVLLLHFRKKDIMYRFDLRGAKLANILDVLKTGLPTAVSRTCIVFRGIFLNRILLVVASSAAVGALTVQNNLNQFFGYISLGLGMVVLMVAGVYYGEEDTDTLKKALKISFRHALVLNGVVMVVLLIAAPLLAGLYQSDANGETYRLAVRAVRWYALCMPLYGVNIVFMNYLQGTGRLMLSNIIAALDNLVVIVLSALLLGNMLGADGVYVSFLICEVVTFVIVLIILAVRNKKMPASVADFTLLPADFDVPAEDAYSMTITNTQETVDFSAEVGRFCRRKGADGRTAIMMSLCAEEIAGNAVEYGFADDKPHVIESRVIKKNEEYILRLRDNCELFNPVTYYEENQTDDPAVNIGLRMVLGVARDVSYVSALKLNNLIIRL